jgi:MFS transporter, YNFM family, putative membrane transport protein
VVVIAVAMAGWVWGPVSDRIGRKRALILASGLLIVPTLAVALAPSFPLLLLFRALQGLCMPGLLIVGVPYVAEVFTPELGGRAMGCTWRRCSRAGWLGGSEWASSPRRPTGAWPWDCSPCCPSPARS